MGKVIMGGLLYPLSEDIGEESPSSYFSSNLFGEESGDKASIKFIIDGVYCPEIDTINKEELSKHVDNMINRLKKHLRTRVE